MRRYVLLPLLLAALAGGIGAARAEGYSARTLYLLHCSGCHGVEGMGEIRADVPPINGYIGAFLQDAGGRRYLATVGGMETSGLDDAEKARVLNWMMDVFGGDHMPANPAAFDEAEVRDLRAAGGDSVRLRREIVARLAEKGIAMPEYPWP